MGEQAGAKYSSAQCPEYMGLAAAEGPYCVAPWDFLRERMLCLFQFILPSYFFMTHLCEVWNDVYTFKTQPGMKLMSGGISITAQIIGLSVYRLCQVRTAQHQNGRMISIPDPERALSEGWGSLVDECASL